METGDRLFATIATGIIWGAVVLIITNLSDQLNSINGGSLPWVFLFTMIAAAAATSSVWRGGRRDSDTRDAIREKAKSSRVQKLLKHLSEEDLDELRTRLSSSDGEMSLDDLLTEKQQRGGR